MRFSPFALFAAAGFAVLVVLLFGELAASTLPALKRLTHLARQESAEFRREVLNQVVYVHRAEPIAGCYSFVMARSLDDVYEKLEELTRLVRGLATALAMEETVEGLATHAKQQSDARQAHLDQLREEHQGNDRVELINQGLTDSGFDGLTEEERSSCESFLFMPMIGGSTSFGGED